MNIWRYLSLLSPVVSYLLIVYRKYCRKGISHYENIPRWRHPNVNKRLSSIEMLLKLIDWDSIRTCQHKQKLRKWVSVLYTTIWMNEWPHDIFLASVYHIIVVLGLYFHISDIRIHQIWLNLSTFGPLLTPTRRFHLKRNWLIIFLIPWRRKMFFCDLDQHDSQISKRLWQNEADIDLYC